MRAEYVPTADQQLSLRTPRLSASPQADIAEQLKIDEKTDLGGSPALTTWQSAMLTRARPAHHRSWPLSNMPGGLGRARCWATERRLSMHTTARIVSSSSNMLWEQPRCLPCSSSLTMHGTSAFAMTWLQQATGNAFAYDSFYRLTYAVPRTDLPVFDPGTFAPPATVSPDPILDTQTAIDTTIGPLAEPSSAPTWAYDLVGNRTTEQQSGGGSVDYQSNMLDQYETVAGIARRYDANGNLRSDGAQTYVYDSLNRLVRVIGPSGGELARYQHDALGRRVLCLAGGSATHIAYNGPHAVTDYLNGNPLAQIVYDDMLDAALHLATGNQDYWYHLDPNRSVRGLTDLTGQATSSYEYTPFGVLQQSSGPYNPLRFTGRRFDGTIGSYDFRSRQYDPATGRFLQRDPSGIRDGTNLYVYAGNDPLAYVDPFGMSREPAWRRRA